MRAVLYSDLRRSHVVPVVGGRMYQESQQDLQITRLNSISDPQRGGSRRNRLSHEFPGSISSYSINTNWVVGVTFFFLILMCFWIASLNNLSILLKIPHGGILQDCIKSQYIESTHHKGRALYTIKTCHFVQKRATSTVRILSRRDEGE